MDTKKSIWLHCDETNRLDQYACDVLRTYILSIYRESNHLTQQQLALELGIPRQRLSRICKSLGIDNDFRELQREKRESQKQAGMVSI